MDNKILVVLIFFTLTLSTNTLQTTGSEDQSNRKKHDPDLFSRKYNLTSGLFKPIQVSLLNRQVDKLIGIPYAQIPNAFEKSHLFNSPSRQLLTAEKWPVIILFLLFIR